MTSIANNDSTIPDEYFKENELRKEIKKIIKLKLSDMLPENDMFTWVENKTDREIYRDTIKYTIKDIKHYLYETIETIEEIKKMTIPKIIKDYFDNVGEECAWYSDGWNYNVFPDFIDVYHTMNQYGLRQAIKKFGKGQKYPTTESLYTSMREWAFKKRCATK